MGLEPEVVGALIGFAALLVGAAVGALFTKQQSRSARAYELYDQYLERCRQNPVFSSFNAFGMKHPGNWTFDPYTYESEEVEIYHWTVTQMLHAMDEIVRIEKSPHWRKTALDQIRFHRDYFDKVWPALEKGYSDTIKELVVASKSMP